MLKELIWNYFNKYKWYIIGIMVFLLIISLYLILKPKENVLIENEQLETKIEKETSKEEEIKVESKVIRVDIKGAVNNPGVHELKLNDRVSDAILVSGGLTNEADTSILNLSKVLQDEMVIIIYTKEEIKEMRKGTTTVKYVEKECICPKLENNACIDNVITNKEEVPEKKESNNTKTETKNGKVNINTASIEELTTLTGIGESKAKAIIDYRNKNGLFKTIDEITNVSGIGLLTYEKIKDNITI